MIIPLAITAAAVLITLVYASVRDIQERRVPYKTWYPMLAAGIPLSIIFFGFSVLDLGEDFFPDFCFLIVGLVITLLSADTLYSLVRYAQIPRAIDILDAGLFFGILSIPLGTVVYSAVFQNSLSYAAILICIFCAVFFAFNMVNLMGGADACALIFIAVLIPQYPVNPVWDYSPLFPFPFTVLINALILNLLTPIAIFLENLRKGHHAPFPSMFFGFPVRARDLPHSFGFIMEEVEETESGRIGRRFLGLSETIRRMVSGAGRIYTKDLRLHPEKYAREISLYQRAGSVWISYGIPFMVPITAGLVTAIFFGDILFTLMKLLAGV